MVDPQLIRENPELIKKTITERGENVDLDTLLDIDRRYRSGLRETEELKAKKNRVSDEIGRLKKEEKEIKGLLTDMKTLSQTIAKKEAIVKEAFQKLDEFRLHIPNLLHDSVPAGKTDADNVAVRKSGEPAHFKFEPLTHFEIGKILGIIDSTVASKLAGSGFAFYSGLGARLIRALVNFMLELHTEEHGYKEVYPPFLVNRASMVVTGQLPKLEKDMYRIEEEDYFLIPTAEVPVTNIHRNEIIDGDRLPIQYVSYTACFRREAGSYGKETKGLIRVHQFDKVELVKFVKPETSFDELEKLLQDAEDVIKRLKLHYRVMNLCSSEVSFAASKCYDIEVWAPGLGKYLEVSSCSNFTDFQARRGAIRFRRSTEGKPEFVHTLNGSGVALPRLIIAILETYQAKDGSVIIPEVLRPYLGGLECIIPQA